MSQLEKLREDTSTAAVQRKRIDSTVALGAGLSIVLVGLLGAGLVAYFRGTPNATQGKAAPVAAPALISDEGRSHRVIQLPDDFLASLDIPEVPTAVLEGPEMEKLQAKMESIRLRVESKIAQKQGTASSQTELEALKKTVATLNARIAELEQKKKDAKAPTAR